MQDTLVRSLGQDEPLEKKMAAHSSIPWRIPWTEEPGGLQSMGLQIVGHNLITHAHKPFSRPMGSVYRSAEGSLDHFSKDTISTKICDYTC